ncbi:hypothetical protein O6H91_11G002100 [Diphasiastrum complanatum]|nr:hypothetical protein O6H91_11G002100 [Diphasiastrum complanatum]
MPYFLSAGKNGWIKGHARGMSVCRIGRCGGRSDGDADGGGNGRSELDGACVGPRRDDVSNSGGGYSFWTRYTSLLQSHPLAIKSLTAGLLNAIADIICQVVLEKVDYCDVKRLLSFTTVGMFLSGPGLHYWYGMLPKLISMPGIGGVVLRTAADQLIFTPLAMGSLFVVLLFLEGRNDQIMAKLQQDWLPTIVANWTVWIPFQIINFGVIPPQLQVVATSFLGMLWSIYISFAGHA